jgi:dipeptidyl aminopeptidase/acylaminoacyl peptidase
VAEQRIAPYGSWRSPLRADVVASATIGLGSIALDGDDTYWAELRPAERGRVVVVHRAADGRTRDITPPSFNARTRVHEYGGGAFVVANHAVVFSHFPDQRLYRTDGTREPEPLTPEAPARYADGVADLPRGRLVFVREDHRVPGREPVNSIAGVSSSGGDESVELVSGNDFYASPRLSSDGGRLAWLTWNHPNMPWDGTELWVGELDAAGRLGRAERIAGGVDESIVQPEWSPDGSLYFISDRTGWWNLYRWRERAVGPLCPMEAEFGVPPWVFGASTYAIESADRLVCAFVEAGRWQLAALDTRDGRLAPIPTPYSSISSVRAGPGRVVFVGASATDPAAIVQLELSSGRVEVLRRSSDLAVDPGYLAEPESIQFPTEKGLTAQAFFYPPRNRDYRAAVDERPPLLVMSHGGPTSATSTAFRPSIQFWTSRGIAVLDVNYGGSTGFGRAYRQRLDGEWGVVDVADCVNGARYLAERGDVDGARLAITGGSAGGYTTLCALTFRDVFRAGASYYGVSDLEALAKETHKFESRYLDRLIGPYPGRRDLYHARSPINFTDRLSRPVIFFQGLEDEIVPPNQAERMVDALRAKGIPVAYLPFAGEQHGLRRAENIKRALEAELFFYARIFGFEPADAIEPVPIANLADAG